MCIPTLPERNLLESGVTAKWTLCVENIVSFSPPLRATADTLKRARLTERNKLGLLLGTTVEKLLRTLAYYTYLREKGRGREEKARSEDMTLIHRVAIGLIITYDVSLRTAGRTHRTVK